MKKMLVCAVVLLFAASLWAAPGGSPKGGKESAGGTSAASTDGLTKTLVEAYFKRMFGYDPQIEVTVVRIAPSQIEGLSAVTVIFSTPEGQRAGTWYVSKDLQHAVVGEVVPFGADPFAEDRAKLAKGAFGPTAGPEGAKMLIVEFADLECPACRKAAPVMDKLRQDFPQARFVFQSFPLPQHTWATRAAAYLDCLARQNPSQAFTFIDSIYSNQREIEEAVRKTDPAGKPEVDDAAVAEQLRHYAQEAGGDPDKVASCAAAPETEGRILRSEELGKSVTVESTPTLFLNGRRVTAIREDEYDSLKALASYEATQAEAGK